MPIVFAPYEWSPETTGSGVATFTLRGIGIDVAGNWGYTVLPSLQAQSEGNYTELFTGVGSQAMPGMYSIGAQSAGPVGIGFLPKLSSSGLYDIGLVPQSGSGSGVMPSMSSVNGEALYGDSSVYGLQVIGYGFETAGDWGIARIPLPKSKNYVFETPQGVYFSMAMGTTASLYASTPFAEVSDALTTSDAHTLDFIYGIVDRAFSLDLLLSASRTASLLDSGSFQDRVQRVLEVATTDGLTLTDDVVDNVIKIVALIDAVRLSDNNIPWRAAAAAVADTLTALSVAVSVADGDITDAATVAEALDARRLAMLHLVDAVSVDAAALGLGVISLTLDDSLDIAGDVLTHTTFIAALTESLNVAVSLTLDGIPYVGFCMNTSLKAVTEFGAYDFNSLAHLRGRMYGARDDGLYLLEGPDDAGAAINASLRTALTRIAGGKQAHVDSAYLGYSSDGQVQIKVITTEATGSKTSRVYQLNPQIAVTNRAGRIKIGKGVKSAYWAFEITNVLGEDFTIDVLELHVLALSRRV